MLSTVLKICWLKLLPILLLGVASTQAQATILEFSLSADEAFVIGLGHDGEDVPLKVDSRFLMDTKAFESATFNFAQSDIDGQTFLDRFSLAGGVSDFFLSIEGVGEFTDADLISASFFGETVFGPGDDLEHNMSFLLSSGSFTIFDALINPIPIEGFLSSNDPIADMFLASQGGTPVFQSDELFIGMSEPLTIRVIDVPEPGTGLLLLAGLGMLLSMPKPRGTINTV